LVLLSGCGIPSLRGPAPAPGLPESFSGMTSATNSAHIGIVEFFDDQVLTRLIAEGLAQNQELRIRNEEVRIASNEVMARRGAYLPFLDFNGRGGFEKTSRFTPLGAAEDQLTFPGGGRFPEPLPNVRFSADLFWQIDIWRQLRNARDAAMQRYVETVEARDYLITQIVSEIAENYYELAALDKRLYFLNQTITLQQRTLEVGRALKEQARGTELAVQRFLAEVRKNESQRLIVNQNIIEVENRINFLAGRYPQRVQRQAWDYIRLDSRVLGVGVPAQILQNRRDVRAAERELAAAGLDVLVARAEFYPKLDITAGIGFEAFSPKYLFDPEALIANAFGELTAPLINKAAIRAEYLSANARQLQAIYDYQRTVLNAFTEVVNSMAKVENYRRSVAIKQQQVRALEESVNIAFTLFNAPIGEEQAKVEYVDVLFTTRDLLEARTNLIETKQQQLSAIVDAYQALGGGYLLSNSGTPFAEAVGPPLELEPEEVPLPPGRPDAAAPPAAGVNNPAPMPGANNPAPMPGVNNPVPMPGANNPMPMPGVNNPPAGPGAGNPPGPAQGNLPPAPQPMPGVNR
jgi:NodT family efflux transporter outer membrane factor (OMF) lipoprotein